MKLIILIAVTKIIITFFLYRSLLNRVSSSLMFVAVLFDCGVWYYVKDLKIFDESSKAKIVENEDKIDKSTT